MIITREELNEIREYIIECLVKKFSHSRIAAKKMVDDSSFLTLLEGNPDYVLHYNLEYWAQYINNEKRTVRN